MNKKFRWGILGGGYISGKFAEGLRAYPDMSVRAVASQSGRTDLQGIAEKVYSRYEQIAEDPEIDAVYIGTLHPQHLECARLCLEARKPVLCEKPVTMNADECRELVGLSQRNHTFFMEAMWTRFLPLSQTLTDMIRARRFGRARTMEISFGSAASPATKRLFEKRLGGGALLDIGVYCVSYANMLLNEHPKAVHSWCVASEEGIDLFTSMQMEYPGGCIVSASCAIDRPLRNGAYIACEQAQIVAPSFWKSETAIRYSADDAAEEAEPVEESHRAYTGNGYGHEAAEARRCIEAGLLESPYMSHQDSIQIMETLDQIRSQCGIRYPQDK